MAFGIKPNYFVLVLHTDSDNCLLEDFFNIKLCKGSLYFVSNFRAEVINHLALLVILTKDVAF